MIHHHFGKESQMKTRSTKPIDDAIAMLRRIKKDPEPRKRLEVSSSTDKEIKEVADGFMAVVAALVAVNMEGVLETVLECEAADTLHKRLSTLLRRMTTIEIEIMESEDLDLSSLC
jgi:hypothetical protein